MNVQRSCLMPSPRLSSFTKRITRKSRKKFILMMVDDPSGCNYETNPHISVIITYHRTLTFTILMAHNIITRIAKTPRALFQYKGHVIFPCMDNFQHKDNTVMRPSYLHSRKPYTGKTRSLYQDGRQIDIDLEHFLIKWVFAIWEKEGSAFIPCFISKLSANRLHLHSLMHSTYTPLA